MKRGTITLCVVLGLCASAAGEMTDASLVKPGRLRLPLMVTDFSGTQRTGAPVTSGVPLPKNLGLRDLSRLRVTDATGRVVPAQFSAMDRWPGGAVRWLLVDFQADVFETETSTYTLRDDLQAAAPATPLEVTDGDGKITVVTGPLRFTISKKAFNLFDELWYDLNGDGDLGAHERMVSSSPENGGVVTAGDWPEQGLKAGTKFYSSARPPSRCVVEESGPVRVSILVEGAHYAESKGVKAPGTSNGPVYQYRCRIQAYAGKPFVRVTYQIHNMSVNPEWKVWPIREFVVRTRINFPGTHAAAFLMDNDHMALPPYHWPGQPQFFAYNGKAAIHGYESSKHKVVLYQDSSGGDQWKQLERNGFNYVVNRSGEVPGVTFRGYRIYSDGEQKGGGHRSPGQVDIRSKDRGCFVTMRDFRQNYPKAIECEQGRVAMKVFPAESKQTYHLEPATGKTHDIQYLFHGAKYPSRHEDWVWQRFSNPLLARAPAEWYATTDAWDMGAARVACIPTSEFDKHRIDGNRVGWRNYGFISAWNPGGLHWNEANQFIPWAMRGDWRAFQAAEASTRWAADLVPIQYETENIPRFWLALRGWNWRESKLKKLTYPGYVHHTKWIGVPDSGHMGMLMYLDHYRMTGDRFSRDAVLRIGLRGRAYSWSNNYNDPVLRVNWCRPRDPDAEPDFTAFNRYTAWPLFDMLQGYTVNGDPQWLKEARTTAMAFRNAMRQSPIGYICTYVNDAGSTATYGRQFPPEIRDRCASANYATFQLGLAIISLAKYYEESGDEDAMDCIAASADVLTHRALNRDANGKPIGWSYCWGDLWGSSGKGGSWMTEQVTMLGYGYRFTGRKDFLDVLERAYAATKHSYNAFGQPGYRHVVHPRPDGAPPAAVRDLRAEAVGNGAVRLTWTAPGDDGTTGRAKRYQVKWSAVSLVERVTNWPPKSEPLPKTKAEYWALAAKHRATIGSFYQAFNVTGEPAPKPAGGTETFVLKGLKPGTVWVALKTFDEGPNSSDLSNVVKVDVK